MGLCCLTPAFATQCITSAKFTQGSSGPTVTNLNLTTSTGTITNLSLEITFTTLGGLKNANTTSGVGGGDFCSLTYGLQDTLYINGSTLAGNNYWQVTYGEPTKSLQSTDCRSTAFNFSETAPHPFNYYWIENVNGGNKFRTKAEVFYYIKDNDGAYIYTCNQTKFLIQLKKVEYRMVSSSALVIDPNLLYNIVGGSGTDGTPVGSTVNQKSGTNLNLTKVASSCSVSTKNLFLGSFFQSAPRNQGILGSLKGTTVTLDCPNLWSGINITPTVTISDAGNPGNFGCNPINTATNGSDAVINLFKTATIGHTPADRYCVYPVLSNGLQFSNTMTFPVINSATYQKSMDIYAGLFKQQGTANPTTGLVSSTLTLTVSYQ